jgi:hypothetical protein
MDLNFKRRKAEMAIADELADELLRNTTIEHAEPELIAHYIALVYERHERAPAADELKRVMGYTSKKFAALHRAADGLAAQEGLS